MNIETLNLSDEELSKLNTLIDRLGDDEDVKEGPPEHKVLNTSAGRINSPLKMRYSAEVAIIKKKWGDLEAIRNHLGISQRKMCQLLMVDPSAWTRWTKYNQEPPPHIYRALSWFLYLQEKDPTAGQPFMWLQTVARPSLPKNEVRILEQNLRTNILSASQEQLKVSSNRVKILLIMNLALFMALSATLILFFSFNL